MIRRLAHTSRRKELAARIMRRATTTPSTCWTRKLQYRSQQEATEIIRTIRRRNSPEADGLVPYRCESCSKWHTGHGLGKDP